MTAWALPTLVLLLPTDSSHHDVEIVHSTLVVALKAAKAIVATSQE